MHAATLLLAILASGLARQWLAWNLRLPVINVLITAGLLLGPVGVVIAITMPTKEIAELIGSAWRSSCSRAAWI